MTKTNAQAKTAAKVQLNDKHGLTEEAKSRKRASASKMAKSPKASNQTALGAAPAKPNDTITSVKPAVSGGAYTAVTTGPATAGGLVTMVPNTKFVGKVAEAAKPGSSYKAFLAIWKEEQKTAPAQLARGVDSRAAPQSAKAVHDKRGKAANKADAVTQKPKAAKVAERKADRAAKAAPKADDNRKLTILDKKFTYGKEGSERRKSWDCVAGSKTVADYAAKGGKLKYLPRWASANAIKLG